MSQKAREKGSARTRGRRLADQLVGRASSGLSALAAHADRGAERMVDAARELRRSPPLEHALAAQARGNLEAAFWLLAEEHEKSADLDVAGRYWELALGLHRAELAADAGRHLVEHYAAAGETELAAQCWIELVSAVRDALVSPKAIACLLPALIRRIEAPGDEDPDELRGLGQRAIRHAVDPRNAEGLNPGVAFRLFEDGRQLNPEAARHVAEVALRSPGLHEIKQARIRAWLDGGDPDETKEPVAPSPAAASEAAGEPEAEEARHEVELEINDAVPVDLADEGLVLEEPSGFRARISYDVIEAITMAEIAGLADEPVRVVDLVLNWRRRAEEPLRLVRLRDDGFDAAKLVPECGATGTPLAALVGMLLERSRAVALPDRDTALGVRLARFEGAGRYQDETFRVA